MAETTKTDKKPPTRSPPTAAGITFAERGADGEARPATVDQLTDQAAVAAGVGGAELSLEERVKINNQGYKGLLADEKSAFAAAALYVPPAPPEVKLANEEQAAAVAQKFYRVTKGGEVRLPGQRYVLQKGKPIGSNLYPIAELLNQGIELTEITAKEAGW